MMCLHLARYLPKTKTIMAETTEVAKMSPASFLIGLLFVLIIAAIVVRSINISIKKKAEEPA